MWVWNDENENNKAKRFVVYIDDEIGSDWEEKVLSVDRYKCHKWWRMERAID